MKKKVWALMDDRRGSVSQARGVLQALDAEQFEIVEKKIIYTKSAALPNWLRGRTLLGINAASKAELKEPYPDIVLSISRRTAPVARYIKKKFPSVRLVQLMHPGNAGLNEFSAVIVPEHDRHKKHTKNMHYIIGCPHQVTQTYLEEARAKWMPTFSDLPKPITAVIVGGAIKKKPFTAENAADLAQAVQRLKERIGGSILLTTSRRTGAQAQKIIVDALQEIPQYAYLWGDTRPNPYSGFLACADNIVVTGDSVSMCCEATGSGKPIYIFCGHHWLTPKHQRFVDSLIAGQYATMLDGKTDECFKPRGILNAAAEIADIIKTL